MSIAQTLFKSDDPRLTAYALGELSDPAERAQVEQLLAASPEARAELADIRTLTATLTAEYDAERAEAASAEATPANVVSMTNATQKRSVFRRFNPWWAVAAVLTLAALGTVVPTVSKVETKVAKRSGQQTLATVPTNITQAQVNQSATDDAAAPPQVAVALATAVPATMPVAPSESQISEASTARQTPSSNSLLMAKADLPGKPAVDEQLRAGAKGGQDEGLSLKPAAPVQLSGATAYTAGTTTGTGGTLKAVAAPPPANAKSTALGSFSFGSGRSSLDKLASSSARRPDFNGFAKEERKVARPTMGGHSETNNEEYLAGTTAPADAPSGIGGSSNLRESEADDETELKNPTTRGHLLRDTDKDANGFNTAQYTHTTENAFLGAKENPLSTFSIDVDTASYAIARRFIESGSLPPADAVRIEEFINYFPYTDAPPAPGNDKPFAIHLEAAACPWDTSHRLVRIGIKGREMDQDKRPPSNLVFLLDVSGSMMPEERLPLIKKSLRLLVERLREDDHVAIVVYAGDSGLALPPTTGDHKDTILRAIETLKPGGSTNGASGIKLAYKVARKGFIKGGTNRVILATDGDFNVGVTNEGDLIRLIEDERKDGVFLSLLGVGTDNLKDSTMQKLADHGNGNYNYIDRLEEGRKVLVNQMSGTLVTIAKDVKIQVEFNPAAVASYRLIGYEKRLLKKEDFNNDKIDAGEIGAGHSVTALYEVVPAGQPTPGAAPGVDTLKYGVKPAPTVPPELDDRTAPTRAEQKAMVAASHELLTVKMRHKAPDSDTSERSYEVALVDEGAPGAYSNASPDFQFSAAVASFGMLLRNSPYKGESSFGGVLELAQAGKGEDANGYRAGFIELVREARGIQRGER